MLHRRAVTLLGRDLIAVVDLLDASTEREFTQLWHFSPKLDVRTDGRSVIATTTSGDDVVRIEQAADGGVPTLSIGDNGDFPGWYSGRYEIKVPASVAGYTVNAPTARYVTLLALGPDAQSEAATICGTEAGISVAITDLAGPAESVTVGLASCDGSP